MIYISVSEFFKQLLDADSKKTDVNSLLSVAQQLNKLGQGSVQIILYNENFKQHVIANLTSFLCIYIV